MDTKEQCRADAIVSLWTHWRQQVCQYDKHANQSTTSAAYKHGINIVALCFHSRHCTATIRKQQMKDKYLGINRSSVQQRIQTY